MHINNNRFLSAFTNKRKWIALLLIICVLFCGCHAIDGTGEDICRSHTDTDNNGTCDSCSENVLVSFDVYSVNDLHGKIVDADTHPGVDEMTTYFKNIRSNNPNTILISAGDMWQGSSESNLTRGNLTTEWMNEIGFDAMILGNHEFDWGEEPVMDNAELADFPFLAINIYERSTNEPVDYCHSSTVIDLGDVQVGIIGAIGDCYTSIAADKVEDIYFKTDSELTELVKKESVALREQGADFIIYTLHDGYEQTLSGNVTDISGSSIASYYDTELSNGYVDLVFEAHTHQKYLLCDEYGVYHFQYKGENKGLSHVRVSYNIANQTSDVRIAELLPTGTYANLEDDPIVEELLEKYDELISPASEIVGTNAIQRQGNEMRQLVADLYYQIGVDTWGDEYDIALGGGFISIRNPWYLAEGAVTYGMLQSLFPFDNDLVLCSIRGQELKDRFFETNHDSYYISYGTYGDQLRSNIDPDETYYVVVDTYSASYKPNRLTVVEEYEIGVYARDLLADYIRDGNLS